MIAFIAFGLLCFIVLLFLGRLWSVGYWRFHRGRKPLNGYYSTSTVKAGKDFDVRFLVQALQQAETFLIENTLWTAANLAYVGHFVHVTVLRTETWADWRGEPLPGAERGRALVVGPHLRSLCHELAHLCEALIQGGVEMKHAEWEELGVWRACRAYDIWLRKRSLDV